MSFILDALKKSEIERQRQIVPGLNETRLARKSRRLPMWAVALAALLAINLIVLLAVMLRGTGTNARPAAVLGRARALIVPAPPANDRNLIARDPPDHFSPLDTTPVYAPEIPVTAAAQPIAAPAAGAAPLAGRLAPSASSGGDAQRASHRPEPLLADTRDASDNQESLPSINEIQLSGAQALPELHLDVHVFASKPAERFVYINMRKYHEGAVLQEGPTLERIRRDGVVLNFQGLRFILPRQS